MSLKEDCAALESLPLKLIIVAVVASLSIVPASEALDNLRTNDFFNRVELQLDCIVTAAKLLAVGGPGGARTIALDFAGEGSVAFQRLTIGDVSGGANMSSVLVWFTNGAVMIKSCFDPAVWMRTKDGHGLVLESPRADLRLSAHIDGSTEYILLEVV